MASRRLSRLLLLLWITSATHAQKPIEEAVIVSATSHPVPFKNLARKVTVLDHEQIARLPVRSVPELLRYAASLEVRARGPLGVQADFSVRGAGFGQVLVLVNGIRLNDSQSGHHNSDIPVLLQDIDRVEILYGPGSSLYGADAFGGTINIITRQKGSGKRAHFSVGEFGLVDGSAGVKFEKNGIRQSFSASGNRSSGFMFDRDFQTIGFTSQSYFGERSFLFISHLGKEFGANGFYGPSPSKEWTNQTLLSFDHQLFLVRQWNVTGQVFYRTHGDHFLWDIGRPGFFENRHRTHAFGGLAKAQRSFSDQTQLTVGVEIGEDWIRSNNLGDHDYSRRSAFAEIQLKLGDRGVLYPGIRYDNYSNFGSSTSPSLSASWWLFPTVKLRSSLGHAFRIPTFTERFYRDPNHQASSSLKPEKAWGAEAGVEWLPQPNWMAGLTLFSRWEQDVIDWIRENPSQKWNTTNIRDLKTRGVEANIQRFLDSGGQLGLQYTYLSSDAGFVPFLSKYVLDYARHSFSAFGGISLPWSLTLGHRIDYKRRADGRSYWILDGRLKHTFGKFNFYVECSNMLNIDYQEIRGVQMPPRWVSAGVEVADL